MLRWIALKLLLYSVLAAVWVAVIAATNGGWHVHTGRDVALMTAAGYVLVFYIDRQVMEDARQNDA